MTAKIKNQTNIKKLQAKLKNKANADSKYDPKQPKPYSDAFKKLKKKGVNQYADTFPLMSYNELIALAHDMKRNGQRETIKVLDGKIIDGRNRFMAGNIAKIRLKYEHIDIDDALSYIISVNAHRRNLSISQKAIVGAKATRYSSTKEKEQFAGSLNISSKSIRKGVFVLKNSSKHIISLVEQNEITVTIAEKIAKLKKADQTKFDKMSAEEIKRYFSESQSKIKVNKKKNAIEVSLDKNDLRSVEYFARQTGRTVDNLLYEAIKDYIERRKQEKSLANMVEKEQRSQAYQHKKALGIKIQPYTDKDHIVNPKIGLSRYEIDEAKAAEAGMSWVVG